jgi:hypothetical protein
VRIQAALDSAKVEALRAARQADSLRVAASSASGLAEARSDSMAIHGLKDSVTTLKRAPAGESASANLRADTLQTRIDSLEKATEAEAEHAKASLDSLQREANRAKTSLDSAIDNQKKQNLARDSIAKALATDTTTAALSPSHSFVERNVPDPERDHYFDDRDANFLNASVIKSIAGEKPADEFFDLKFRMQFKDQPSTMDTVLDKRGRQRIQRHGGWSLFGLTAVDVALSAVNDSASTDSLRRERKKLTEATLALEFGLPAVTRISNGKLVRFRRFFLGPMAKVFSTEPYYGVNFGSVELEGSSFRSSYVYGALLRRFYPADSVSSNNLFFEFFLRSSSVDFFRVLSLRGGVLFPLGRGSGTDRVTSRIAIEVPIVSWPF